MNGPEAIHLPPENEPGTEDLALAELEAELTLALEPRELPAGFADRVLRAAAAGQVPSALIPAAPSPLDAPPAHKGKLLNWPRRWVSGAVAAGLVVGCLVGGDAWHRHQGEQARAAAATAEFLTAERITDQALGQARQQVERAGITLGD